MGGSGKVKLSPHTLCTDAGIRLHGIWAEALVMACLLFAEHDDNSLKAARSMNGRTRVVERRTGQVRTMHAASRCYAVRGSYPPIPVNCLLLPKRPSAPDLSWLPHDHTECAVRAVLQTKTPIPKLLAIAQYFRLTSCSSQLSL